MRSAVVAAAFAAGALAVPHHMHKRVLVTDWDIVYVTDCVTVTEGAEPTPTADSKYANWHWKPSHAPVHQHTTIETSSTMTINVQPTSTSVYVAPVPTTSSIEIIPTTIVYSPTSVSIPDTPTYTPQPVSSESPAPVQSSAPTYGSAPSEEDFQAAATWYHNAHRANHSASALTWDNDLAQAAQQIADTCQFQHVPNVNGLSYGQNIAAGTDGSCAASMSNGWYYGEVGNWDYTWNQPPDGVFEKVGHFTQMVWRDTTTVGCARTKCNNIQGVNFAGYFTVCNYGPAGNMADEYKANVKPIIASPMAAVA